MISLFLFFLIFLIMFLTLFLCFLYFFNYGMFLLEFSFPYFIDVSFVFLFDYVSTLFFSFVSMISALIFFYSKYYMQISEKENFDDNRFIFLLGSFVLSMFFLVFSYSWFLIMLGWDGLGIVSFLLVIFYNNSSSLDSGILTVLTNRVGDCFFLLSFFSFFFFGDYSYLFMMKYDSSMSFLVILLLSLGCFTKSAQMPFSAWLPAAMAAPTPVSSLVHSSTLVTAGIFLMIRFNYLLKDFLMFFLVFSLLTMLLGGAFACFELDFKKIVAMSTLSQLGFMIFSIFSVGWLMGFFHLLFHAFFKSMLFLSTGNLMHFILGGQDSRYFSGFSFSFFSKIFFLASCLSLFGFPFFLGFYSKDMILSLMMLKHGNILVLSFVFSCVFTVCYSMRIIYLGFMNYSNFLVMVSVKEEFFFFFPVLFIFFIVVFFGNFFLVCFFPFFLFSFLELFLGLLIIFLGFLLFFFTLGFSNKNKLYFFLIDMMSMNFYINKMSKSFLFKMNYFFFDYTWMEKFSVGFLMDTMKMFKLMSSNLFFFNFMFYFSFVIILLLLI